MGELVRADERGEAVSIKQPRKESTRIVPSQPNRLEPLPPLIESGTSIKIKGRGVPPGAH